MDVYEGILVVDTTPQKSSGIHRARGDLYRYRCLNTELKFAWWEEIVNDCAIPPPPEKVLLADNYFMVVFMFQVIAHTC